MTWIEVNIFVDLFMSVFCGVNLARTKVRVKMWWLWLVVFFLWLFILIHDIFETIG